MVERTGEHQLTATNSGSGTLANVQTSESKSWLSVARSGSGNNQTLTNSINISGVSAGSYSGTVTVTASNASSSKTYTVNLTVAEAGPALALSPTSLSFASQAGGSNPASKDVTVSNTGGGTLADVQVSESAGWLSVTRSGSGDSQTLVNSVDIAGLAEGTFNTTVDVSATGAGSKSYTVTLVLSEELILASIQVTATATHILSGQSVDVSASARDQYDNPFPAEITWSASSGGSMSPASSGSAVTEHDSTFTSDGSAGTFTIVASSGGVEGSTTITVEGVTIPLRINCGSNEYAVDGWMADDAVVSGGGDWTNPNDIVTDGVANAAPAYVYKSVRHLSPHSYDIPIPDGNYILRLHFADAYSDRAMTFVVEGDTVLTDFDPSTAAGGLNIAVVQDFQISVSGGLQIEASSDSDVFESGIEVLPIPNEAPIVDAGSDKTILFGETAHLDGVVDDNDEVSSEWSVDLGPGEVTFADGSVPLTTATFSEVGYYVLRLSADDGDLSGSDTMSVTVNAEDDIVDDDPPTEREDETETVAADLADGLVIEGSCTMNATGRTPMATLLVLVLWRVARRRRD